MEAIQPQMEKLAKKLHGECKQANVKAGTLLQYANASVVNDIPGLNWMIERLEIDVNNMPVVIVKGSGKEVVRYNPTF